MALDWNKIISISDDGSVDSFGIERVILVTGQRGDMGKQGEKGESGGVWGAITGDISRQVDLQRILILKLEDAPSNDLEYVRKNGAWAVSTGGSGQGEGVWGAITGELQNQTDLKDALDAKADSADLGALADHDTIDYETEIENKPSLGTISEVDDAPSDEKVYGRKNGIWAEALEEVNWGMIGGTLAAQTDLYSRISAIDGKTDLEVIADFWDDMAGYAVGDHVIYEGRLYEFTFPVAEPRAGYTLHPLQVVQWGIGVEVDGNDFVKIDSTSIAEDGAASPPMYGLYKSNYMGTLSYFSSFLLSAEKLTTPDYNPEDEYEEGDVVLYGGNYFWISISDEPIPNEWDPEIVNMITVEELVQNSGSGDTPSGGTTDSGWLSIEGTASNDENFIGKILYRIYDKMVFIQSDNDGVHLKSTMSTTGIKLKDKLFADYLPIANVRIMISSAQGYLQINSNLGDLFFYKLTSGSYSSGTYFYFSGSYMIA